MENIGLILKDKREKKKLDIKTVCEETGIKEKFIESLENNDFRTFQNRVYARAALRDYANYLCLETHSLLEALDEEFEKIKEEDAEKEIVQEEPPVLTELPDEKSFLGKTWGIFIIFILLCGCAFFVGKAFGVSDKPKDALAPATVSEPAKPDNISEVPQATQKSVSEPAGKKETDVTVYAHKNLWISVEKDGKKYFEGTLLAGASIDFKIKEYLKLRGGEPSACQINVNGKSIGALGNPGKPFNLTLKPGTNAVINQ